ncbi:MAG: SDR family oxidoreductase [Pirellulaceae bacterium]|nr:SDR family oxidoreductase [Pirellulaceae bacterium]
MTVLLTGATGLVGRFLLAGLLRQRIPTIALVRGQPHRSPAARIDEALAPFETHNLLPRPTVLEADLTAPGLGLSSQALQQLQAQPLRLLHSAASIRFQANPADGEPYATNVKGTRHLLELARHLTVSEFHHVSTAYVQCDRTPGRLAEQRTAREVPVPLSAPAGNDYERSKIQSENLILDCRHIGLKSIYRPSIVVGDSQSGYTSTYHGFYAPLQIAYGLVRAGVLDAAMADDLRHRLGLTANDSKNLVPVDWLAAAILHLMQLRTALGGIYHLTHPQPALLHDIQQAIIAALQESMGTGAVQRSAPLPEFDPELFGQQMAVYASYFQDDPPFDRSRTAKFLGDLPCPAMDFLSLKRLALAAIANNFGWPKPQPPLRSPRRIRLVPSAGQGSHPKAGLAEAQVDLEILGGSDLIDGSQASHRFYRQGGQWCLNSVLSSNTIPGRLHLVVTEQSLLSALIDKIAPEELLSEGRWLVRGELPVDWLDILHDWLRHLSIEDVEKPVSGIMGM